ncbi:hypothetical protein TraAM80_00786 [Trypanosoma rangeli]|uniref:IQ calmodulin-binding motif domain-containing protein n=1 Tax=Trypanosoma rangeli TaxID=5698 RepID=A0A422P1U1_TRYRA|nr:uncharacterized protein TraAM80_00786 [Trypanosoma rangeli]RNF11702.1 hypothetical protein TraAM80_00786 [Trypanosoma rangeli]|eukprot:RNF11702.1 hypothetical protein TraAM80_00786 [Trypanosoma rangeli]
MKQALGGRKVKGTAKKRVTLNLPGTRSEALAPVPPSEIRDGGSRAKGFPARRAQTNSRRRVPSRLGPADSTVSVAHGKCRGTPPMEGSVYGTPPRDGISMLGVSFFCSLFAASMRRTIVRYRQRVVWEMVKKPQAAFLIQTAWRKHQQHRRMQLEVLSRVLVPFLYRKLRRIRAAKERSAFLLQRVFRSQKERHFMHWLYQQMKRGRALALVRRCLKRYVARRYVAFLALQRDERVVCEERCVIASIRIIREEREELLWIFQFMKTTSTIFTPLAVTDVCGREEGHNTAFCTLPPLLRKAPEAHSARSSPFPESSFGQGALLEAKPLGTTRVGAEGEFCSPKRQNSSSEIPSVGKGDTLSWTSLLHNEEGARQLVRELFALKAPQYPLSRTGLRRGLSSGRREKVVADSVTSQDSHTSRNEVHCSWWLSGLARGRGTSAEGTRHVGLDQESSQAKLPIDDSATSVNQLMNAFIELLVCTESTERKALEMDLQSRHTDIMKKMGHFVTTMQASIVAPPLYHSLLSTLGEPWVVRRAELLFREEYEARLKIVEEYNVTPLRFLNRPLLNPAAEERRQRLQERLRTIKRRERGRRENVAAASPLPLATIVASTSGMDEKQTTTRCFTDISVPATCVSRDVTAEASTLKLVFPTTQFGLPQPPPPSSPPQKAYDNARVSSTPLPTVDASSGRRIHRHGSLLLTVGSPAFLHAAPTESVPITSRANIGTAQHDAFAIGRGGALQETSLVRASPTPLDTLTCPTLLLPPIVGCQHKNNTVTEIENGISMTELQSCHPSQCLHLAIPPLDTESLGSALLKKAAPTAPDISSGGVDTTTMQKSWELGMHASGCGTPRRAPIPLLLSSTRSQRDYMFELPRHSFLLEKDFVTGKEGGADYVRRSRLCSSPAHPTTGLAGVNGSPRPVQLSSWMGHFFDFKLQTGHSPNARRLRKQLSETSNLSVAS